jgi:hypothetical protein
MTTSQITETELSPDEAAYAEVSAKLTAVNVSLEQAEEAFNLYRYSHTIPTPDVIARSCELREEIERWQRELQRLLPAFSEAKSRVNGWR